MFGRKRKLDDFTSEIEAYIRLEIERLRDGMSGLSQNPWQGKLPERNGRPSP
jgi:hypothetical protein